MKKIILLAIIFILFIQSSAAIGQNQIIENVIYTDTNIRNNIQEIHEDMTYCGKLFDKFGNQIIYPYVMALEIWSNADGEWIFLWDKAYTTFHPMNQETGEFTILGERSSSHMIAVFEGVEWKFPLPTGIIIGEEEDGICQDYIALWKPFVFHQYFPIIREEGSIQ